MISNLKNKNYMKNAQLSWVFMTSVDLI